MPQSSNRLKELLLLNLGIVFISTSGVLGKYVTMSSTLVIFYRSLIGYFVILVVSMCTKKMARIGTRQDHILMFLSGLLMGAHWLTYFYSLDYSSVAIAMLTLFVHPAITAVLEPLLLRIPVKKMDLILGVVVLCGLYIMVSPIESLSQNTTLGIYLGLGSALCYSLRNIVTRRLTERHDGLLIMLAQLGIVAVLLSPFLLYMSSDTSPSEWVAIAALGVFTSAFGHLLYVGGLKVFRASTVGILSAILPIYGIVWGYWFLSEVPSINTIVGGLIILSVVVFDTLYSQVKKRR